MEAPPVIYINCNLISFLTPIEELENTSRGRTRSIGQEHELLMTRFLMKCKYALMVEGDLTAKEVKDWPKAYPNTSLILVDEPLCTLEDLSSWISGLPIDKLSPAMLSLVVDITKEGNVATFITEDVSDKMWHYASKALEVQKEIVNNSYPITNSTDTPKGDR